MSRQEILNRIATLEYWLPKYESGEVVSVRYAGSDVDVPAEVLAQAAREQIAYLHGLLQNS